MQLINFSAFIQRKGWGVVKYRAYWVLVLVYSGVTRRSKIRRTVINVNVRRIEIWWTGRDVVVEPRSHRVSLRVPCMLRAVLRKMGEGIAK